jgi:hypothetical protein
MLASCYRPWPGTVKRVDGWEEEALRALRNEALAKSTTRWSIPASLWNGAREAELWSEMKRQVGFDRWPENAAEFVAEFIATTSGTSSQ